MHKTEAVADLLEGNGEGKGKWGQGKWGEMGSATILCLSPYGAQSLFESELFYSSCSPRLASIGNIFLD